MHLPILYGVVKHRSLHIIFPITRQHMSRLEYRQTLKIEVRKLFKNIFSYVLWFGEVPKDLSVLDKRDEKLIKPTTT